MSGDERPPSLLRAGFTSWCVHGSHLACPVVVHGVNGSRECACPCHEREAS